jgi:hypothetical protein
VARRKIAPGLRRIQAEIFQRYPGPTHSAMWIRILASGDPDVALTIDNIGRCLRQNLSPEDLASLEWLRGEIENLGAKREANTKAKGHPQPQPQQQMPLDFGPCLKPFF